MEFRAEARYMRVSPQKARLVLNLIKGRRVEEARNTLAFTKKRVAATVGKLLQSAIDNANFLSTEKGLDVDLDNLYVQHAVAADGACVSLCAAHFASRNCAGGEKPEWRAGRDRNGGGRREISEGCASLKAESKG